MINGVDAINLFSANAKKLADFYKNKVGLKVSIEAEMGDNGEEVYGFEFDPGPTLFIMDRPKIPSKSKEPNRFIFSLEVDDIEKETSRLEESGVKKTQDTYHIEGYGYITTFEDLDGNLFQIAQVKG